jgi:hypothetical protein
MHSSSIELLKVHPESQKLAIERSRAGHVSTRKVDRSEADRWAGCKRLDTITVRSLSNCSHRSALQTFPTGGLASCRELSAA